MIIYFNKSEALWLKELIDVYLTVVQRDESNQKRGKEIIAKLTTGLENYETFPQTY